MRVDRANLKSVFLAALAMLAALGARNALAADANPWPAYPLDPDYFRGFGGVIGGYLSIWKITGCWLLFLGWVHTSDWISQDAQLMRQRYQMWNPIVVGVFALAFLLVWVIPLFSVGFLLMFVAWAAPLTTYILYRNARVEEHQKVLTKEHLRHWYARQLRRFGIKIEADAEVAKQAAAPDVQFTLQGGGSKQEDEGQHLAARQMPGYEPAQRLISDALTNRADALLIDVGGNAAAIRYLIDGVWHNCAPQPAPMGESLQAAFRTLAWLDSPAAPQAGGAFGAKRAGTAYECRVTTQVAEGARRMVLRVRAHGMSGPTKLDELGVRAKAIEQITALMGLERGLLLFSSAPAGGLTTLVDVVLNSCDRFMRDFAAVEDAQRREHDITNVEVTTYNSASGESPATVLPKVARRRPNVLVVRDLVNADTVKQLSAQAAERLIVAAIPARDACEALLRVLLLKAPPREFAAAVTAVVHSRLLRRLCENCKEPYPPPPELLQQLGIPEGKVEVFYRPRQEKEAICDSCRGIGYRGRIGLYELLQVSPAVREVLIKTPQIEPLRKAAREAGLISARDQAILLVARGVTSLEEVQRVLKS